VIAHGSATIIDAAHPDFGELDELQVQCGGGSVREWSGDGVYLCVAADRVFTYAREPERYDA
jgi:hypothetical protein